MDNEEKVKENLNKEEKLVFPSANKKRKDFLKQISFSKRLKNKNCGKQFWSLSKKTRKWEGCLKYCKTKGVTDSSGNIRRIEGVADFTGDVAEY